MTRRPRQAGRSRAPIRLWSFPEAQAVVPYLTSVLRSLREHGLEAQTWQQRQKRLADRPGRPDRATLIAQQEATRELERATRSYDEAEEEVFDLGIFPLDPLNGTALVPFEQDGELAWYIFDLFDAAPLAFWRFQNDPEEMRRPVTSRQKGLTGATWNA